MQKTTSSGAAVAAYVYGVVPAGAASAELFSGVMGVAPGEPVEVVEHGLLAALVSRVPLGEFGEGAIEERLQDPEWLARAAQAHGRVLGHALAAGAVIPFRFGAIFHAGEDVTAFLARREGELARELRRVAGKVELGVKAVADADLADRVRGVAEARRLEEALAVAAPGRRYLLEKQLRQVVAREASALRASIAEESHAALAAVADAGVLNPLQDGTVAGFEGDMLLNAAYLVGADAQDTLTAEVDALRGRFAAFGIRFELTGPWPPYNFVERGAA
jgi:hypothetical protein